MKTLFLSHCPHQSHLAFARSIDARTKVLPLKKYTELCKVVKYLGFLIIPISFILSLFIRLKEDIILVEGGTSFYTAVFLKWRHRNIRIIYMDVDLLFYGLKKRKVGWRLSVMRLFLREIDGIISDSEQNSRMVPVYIDVPKYVARPFPKNITESDGNRKNYGLYVGRLDTDKNIKRIISFGLQCPYFEKFVVIGDGALRKYVERISSKNEKLSYLGVRMDVGNYYSLCRFLIHIPDADPHPCTTMEAALGGCFPVISRGVGTAYLFDDLFIIDDPEDFIEINMRIKQIIDNNVRAEKLLHNSVQNFPTEKESVERFRNIFEKTITEAEK